MTVTPAFTAPAVMQVHPAVSAPAVTPRTIKSSPRVPRRGRNRAIADGALSTSRIRASSPRSKSRYISRLRDTLDSRCAKAEDAFWSLMQEEARDAAEGEPLLASFLFATVLNHRSLLNALAFHLANKLCSPAMPSTMLMRLFTEIMSSDPSYMENVRQDLFAVMERDPACTRFIDALLYFKGFHALQAHRVAHALWEQGRTPLAYHLQSQVSQALQVDIHPAASIGPGAFFDHATGVVIGETAVIGRNVSMLHHVTLGGSGKKHGERHPKIGDGVLVGAGATLLGNVVVGEGAQIGACSLVLEDIPPHSTVVGVPAKVVNRQGVAVPALDMKHERCLPGCTDENHGHDVPRTGEASAERAIDDSPAVKQAQSANGVVSEVRVTAVEHLGERQGEHTSHMEFMSQQE